MRLCRQLRDTQRSCSKASSKANSKARETCPRGKVRESPVERHTEKLPENTKLMLPVQLCGKVRVRLSSIRRRMRSVCVLTRMRSV